MFTRNHAGYLASGLFTLSGLFIGFGGGSSPSEGSYQTVTGDNSATAKEKTPGQEDQSQAENPKQEQPKAEEPATDKKKSQPKPTVEAEEPTRAAKETPAKPPVEPEDKTKKPDHSPPKEETPFVADNKVDGEKVISQNPANKYANNTFGAIWKDKLLDTTNVDWWKPREIKFKQLVGEYLIHSNDFIQAYRDLKQSTKEPDGRTLMEVCKKYYSVLDEDKYLERLDIWSYCKL